MFLLCVAGLPLSTIHAQKKEIIDDEAPNGIVIVTIDKAGDEIIRIMNESQLPYIHDPKAPRFLLMDKQGKFAAAEGAIGIARTANKVRKEPLRVILNGLGKDAAQIISRINGFTYVKTDYDFATGELKVVETLPYSDGERAAVKCYGANDVLEGVAIMKAEGVEVSITGNSTNPTRFQHLVAGTYKKWAIENGKKYFSVASGGGTGRTLHPDNVAAGPASYGLTDSMGRMHGDAQFAGSSSVPAHVEMMGLIGAGNNPMVGMTVACAVAASQANA